MVKIIDRSAFFKAVNMVASVMVGHRSARMALAHAIVSECRLNEVNTLFKREAMTQLVKLVVSAGITPETVEAAKQADAEKPKKERKQRKQRAPKAPQAPKEVDNSESPLVWDGVLPSNIEDNFSEDEAETVREYIQRFVNNANKYANINSIEAGKTLFQKKVLFGQGMDALENVYDFEGLQFVMVTYFLQDLAKVMIGKMMLLGLNYKRRERVKSGSVYIANNEGAKEVSAHEQANAWQYASSNAGRITAYEVDEIYNDLVVDSSRLVFDENMFTDVAKVATSIYYRISNILQVRMRELRNQTKVYTERAKYVQEETASVSTEVEALNLADDMGVFTADEMEIIRLRIEGYQKKEIDAMVGKRTDRDFKRMCKKYQTA